MKFTGLTPTLYTRDIRGSIAFYVTMLGFTHDGPIRGRRLRAPRRGGDHVRVAERAHAVRRPLLTGALYIRCDDVDEAWAKVKDAARVCYPIEDFDYGMREFAIFDNNGYLLQFGQEIDAAS